MNSFDDKWTKYWPIEAHLCGIASHCMIQQSLRSCSRNAPVENSGPKYTVVSTGIRKQNISLSAWKDFGYLRPCCTASWWSIVLWAAATWSPSSCRTQQWSISHNIIQHRFFDILPQTRWKFWLGNIILYKPSAIQHHMCRKHDTMHAYYVVTCWFCVLDHQQKNCPEWVFWLFDL